jgi:Zn-dependent protease with chaperone function
MKRSRTNPPASVVRKEQRHRRAVLFGLSVLLVLVMSPLLGHHLPVGFDEHLAGRDHLWALCLVALQVLMAPIHGGFHLLFFAGLGYAAWDRVQAWRTQRVVLGALNAAVPDADGEIGRTAAALDVPPEIIRVVEGLPSPALTAGWLKPRVYLSASLPEWLSPAELRAVIAHEAAHVRRRDPLRLSLLRFLACTLFWLPAVGRLAEDVADEAEVKADDAAVLDQPLALASAIVTLAQWLRPLPSTHDRVGFDERDLLQRRVLRLAGEDVSPRSRLTRTSLAGATLALLFAWTSGAVMAHPLPGQTPAHEEHCHHDGASVLLHLVCLGHRVADTRSDCLHR